MFFSKVKIKLTGTYQYSGSSLFPPRSSGLLRLPVAGGGARTDERGGPPTDLGSQSGFCHREDCPWTGADPGQDPGPGSGTGRRGGGSGGQGAGTL